MKTSMAEDCIARVATTLAAADPAAALAGHGIALAAREERLEFPGRNVHGAWDPVLRRIELFDVVARPDDELVATFAHELLHALGGRTIREMDEADVQQCAHELVRTLGERDIRRIARRLRP